LKRVSRYGWILVCSVMLATVLITLAEAAGWNLVRIAE